MSWRKDGWSSFEKMAITTGGQPKPEKLKTSKDPLNQAIHPSNTKLGTPPAKP